MKRFHLFEDVLVGASWLEDATSASWFVLVLLYSFIR